jgi:glycolate oxidase FAD binding subunit
MIASASARETSRSEPPAPIVRALAAQIAEAATHGEPLRVVGGGTWLHAARACIGAPVDIGHHTGIVEYVPGDLTLTAYAGTTLAELAEATAEHGQWLGLDPVAAPNATIGATIATASDGPLASALGRVRDLVLGVECITGSGEIIRAGGRVVKNVAGFDLVRLQTGAWGTLGVISEVTVRLRARPAVDRAFVVRRDADSMGNTALDTGLDTGLHTLLDTLATLPIEPLAVELLNPARAAALDLPHGECLLVRLGGNTQRVAAQARELLRLGVVDEISTDVFTRLSAGDVPPGPMPRSAQDVVARVSHSPTRLAETWRHVLAHCRTHQQPQPLVRASVARGVARVVLPAEDAARVADWSAFVRGMTPVGAHTTWEQLPSNAWAHVPCAVDDALSAGLRRTLDPARVLNRGLLGERTAPMVRTA